jgi:hypothetical protein
MSRNPDRNFPDLEQGIKVTRPVKVKNPLLENEWQEVEQLITLPDDQFRLIELFDSTGPEYQNQFRVEVGEWGTEQYIIYFDLVSGDEQVIKKGDYIYFNYKTGYLVPFDESRTDIKKLIIKNIPRQTGLTAGLTGVDCGMLEVLAIAS